MSISRCDPKTKTKTKILPIAKEHISPSRIFFTIKLCSFMELPLKWQSINVTILFKEAAHTQFHDHQTAGFRAQFALVSCSQLFMEVSWQWPMPGKPGKHSTDCTNLNSTGSWFSSILSRMILSLSLNLAFLFLSTKWMHNAVRTK